MSRLPLLAVFLALPACAHVDAITKDVEGCIQADAPAALQSLERAAVPMIGQILECEATSQDPTGAIPMCVEEGLAGVCSAMGPDAERFKECVVSAIEMDPAASPLARNRAHAVKVAIIKSRNGR